MRESTLPTFDGKPRSLELSQQRQMALSRWVNEGGAGPDADVSIPWQLQLEAPPLTNTELVQLRIRMIAMENLMIALLAESSDRQRELARGMAAYITPRQGFTPHPLTIHAATQMLQLVERADHFRTTPPA